MQSTQGPTSYGDPNYAAQQQQYGQSQYGQYGGRPGKVTAAAVIFLIFGVLITLFGVLALIGGAALGGAGLGNLGGALGGAVAVFGVILLLFGVLEILTGINLFSGKGWARILGFILGALGLLFGVLGLLGSFAPTQNIDLNTGLTTTGGPNVVNIVIQLIVIAAYAYALWALATSGRFFSRT